jgi:putative ABC transport system substrate-binding protein
MREQHRPVLTAPLPRFRPHPGLVVLISGLVLLVLIALTACGSQSPDVITIGVVNLSSALDTTLDGFKDGFAEAGYTEGDNVVYLYNGVSESIDDVDADVQSLVGANVDLILAISTPSTLNVKQATRENSIPVVFGPVTDPIGSGIVDDLRHPAGNLTGVSSGGNIPKQLEWTLAIVPEAKRLLVLHDPEDSSSVQGLIELSRAAETLQVELDVVEVTSAEEIAAAFSDIPADIDVIFMLPSSLFSGNVDYFVEASLESGLPITSGPPLCQQGVTFSYGLDYYLLGKQMARLAVRILQGENPADIPVEQCDFYLGINLKSAQDIGLEIPDHIVDLADDIVR